MPRERRDMAARGEPMPISAIVPEVLERIMRQLPAPTPRRALPPAQPTIWDDLEEAGD